MVVFELVFVEGHEVLGGVAEERFVEGDFSAELFDAVGEDVDGGGDGVGVGIAVELFGGGSEAEDVGLWRVWGGDILDGGVFGRWVVAQVVRWSR